MSGKSSRNKKRPRPQNGGPQGKVERPGGAGQPAPRGQAAVPGAHGPVPQPLQAFRAPALQPPSTISTPPRIPNAPVRGRPAGTAPAERAAVLEVAASGASVASAPAPSSTTAPSARPTAAVPPSTGEVPDGAPRAPFLAADMPAGPVQVMSWNCTQLEGVEPQGLGLTYWFDAAPAGDPYPVSIRFTGRRVSGGDPDGAAETFETVRTLERILPGSGRIALTTRVPDVAPGTWEVTATPVVLLRPDGSPASPPPPLPLPGGTSTGTTAFLPVVRVRAPGVRIGAWPALVGLGFVAALILQWVLGLERDLPVGRMLTVSVVASLVGLAGAKVYYLLTHREERPNALTAGMSVQGFVIAAISTLVLGAWAAGVPIGAMLDVAAPGLLLGMTIGRLGCFFGGCCVGLPTASRWGIWSSDRGVGVRRIPVQLFESSMAGVVATATLLAVVFVDPAVDGLLFLAGLSAYTFGRQLLFPLRGIPRKTAHGRMVTMVVTGLVLVGSVLVLLLT